MNLRNTKNNHAALSGPFISRSFHSVKTFRKKSKEQSSFDSFWPGLKKYKNPIPTLNNESRFASQQICFAF